MADWLEKQGWEEAPLSPSERALCKWAEKLTRAPGEMAETDVLELREQGWSDLEIHDAAQVVAYFNYINRLADGLGVDLEEGMK
ncbi:MAG: hypothetical protein QGH51_10575 [Planctomycetota bacterium]|nr:hypothetical protein [Planctomycetota bacterium]